jgi:ATP-dependent Clp protease protease subunit
MTRALDWKLAADKNDVIDKFLFQNHIFFLSEEIDTKKVLEVIKWITYENFNYEKEKVLKLYINSEGGSLYDAFALIDVMRTSKIPIHTYGIGNLMSAAFLIFISGAQGGRNLGKNTSVLCHQFSMEQEGKSHEIQATMKEVDFCNEKMIRVIQDSCNMRRDSIITKLLPPSDVWLTPEEVVKMKLADNIF